MSNQSDRDIRALRENIEETRQRISGEVEAISERLTPQHAKQVAKEKLVETKDRAIERVGNSARHMATSTGDAGRRMGGAVRDNPVPAAMVCVGAGWLMWKAFEPKSGPTAERLGRTRERARGLANQARDRANLAATSARGRVSEQAGIVRHRVGESANAARARASQLAESGRYNAQRAWVSTQGSYDTNPLAFGAAALVVGVGLGMILPHTRREDRVLGQKRQQMLSRAQEVAHEAKEVAVESARSGARAARDTARREAEHRDLR